MAEVALAHQAVQTFGPARIRQDLGQALDDGSEGGPGLPQDARPHPSGFHTVNLAGSTRAKAIGVLASVAVFLAALAAVAWMAMPRHPEVRLPEGMARRPVQPSGPPALPVPRPWGHCSEGGYSG